MYLEISRRNERRSEKRLMQYRAELEKGKRSRKGRGRKC